MSTLADDLHEIAADYAGLIGRPLDDHQRQLVWEELNRTGPPLVADWYEALVHAAAGGRYVTVAAWIASARHERDRRRDREAVEAAKSMAPAPPPRNNDGWPIAPGQPESAYLLWLSALATMRSLRARATADRYVGAGLVRRQHADRVLRASGQGDSGRERSESGRREVEAIEREVRAAA